MAMESRFSLGFIWACLLFTPTSAFVSAITEAEVKEQGIQELVNNLFQGFFSNNTALIAAQFAPGAKVYAYYTDTHVLKIEDPAPHYESFMKAIPATALATINVYQQVYDFGDPPQIFMAADILPAVQNVIEVGTFKYLEMDEKWAIANMNRIITWA